MKIEVEITLAKETLAAFTGIAGTIAKVQATAAAQTSVAASALADSVPAVKRTKKADPRTGTAPVIEEEAITDDGAPDEIDDGLGDEDCESKQTAYTQSDILTALNAYVKRNGRDAARDLLAKKFKVKSAKDISAKDYPRVMELTA